MVAEASISMLKPIHSFGARDVNAFAKPAATLLGCPVRPRDFGLHLSTAGRAPNGRTAAAKRNSDAGRNKPINMIKAYVRCGPARQRATLGVEPVSSRRCRVFEAARKTPRRADFDPGVSSATRRREHAGFRRGMASFANLHGHHHRQSERFVGVKRHSDFRARRFRRNEPSRSSCRRRRVWR